MKPFFVVLFYTIPRIFQILEYYYGVVNYETIEGIMACAMLKKLTDILL